MKNATYVLILAFLSFSCSETSVPDVEAFDEKAAASEISFSVDNWNTAWKTKDVELAIRNYAEETDWTNAFGDRVQSKSELRALLEEIFAMDFVMEGKDNYQNEAVQFLNNGIALLRSTNIRTGQKWVDGTPMKDRHIHHLRVYQKTGEEWKIISHMINQANERN